MIGYSFAASPLVPGSSPLDGWRWHRLTELARLATGHTPSRRYQEYWKGDIPWIQLPDIRALDGQTATETSEHINALGIENSAAVLLPTGTVCLSRTASVGFVTMMGRPMATSQDFVNWVCGPNLDPRFLMYLLLANREPIRDLGSGAVHHTVYFPTVESFSVCVPSVVEQRRIAAALAEQLVTADAARGAANERLAAAEALPHAYVDEVFRESASWEMRTLGDVVQGTGQYGTSQRSNPDGQGLPVLGMPHIHRGRIRWQNISTIDLPPSEVRKYELASGDILFNRTNSAELVGKTAVFDGSRRAVFASYLIRYRANVERADPHFISAYINSPLGREYIERHMARAIGQVNISASTMHRMPLLCPPVDEQRRLMSSLRGSLDAAEALVGRCSEELSVIRAMPAAFLKAAFLGES